MLGKRLVESGLSLSLLLGLGLVLKEGCEMPEGLLIVWEPTGFSVELSVLGLLERPGSKITKTAPTPALTRGVFCLSFSAIQNGKMQH